MSYDTENLIYGKHHTLRFHMKRMLARLLLKLGKRKPMPDDVVDQLQIFSEADEMVIIVKKKEINVELQLIH